MTAHRMRMRMRMQENDYDDDCRRYEDVDGSL
jgi:hypothetical protein